MSKDLKNIILELGANMLKMAELGEDIEQNKNNILESIANGKAYEKFLQMVERQGGDISYLQDLNKFEKSKYQYEVLSKKTGVIEELPADIIAQYVCKLGAGRIRKDDIIDKQVGIVLNKKVGDKIEKGEKILTIYSNKELSDFM